MANTRQVGNIAEALILFADIVDSSKYSAILGYEEYARRLIAFQDIFQSLGRRYFPKSEDEAVEYSQVSARGDEGIVFIVASDPKERERLVFRAIEFLYHLKGLLRYCSDLEGNEGDHGKAPSRFDIGAGVHWGQVVQTTTRTEAHRQIIEGIEGFAVNYTKRIESSSRHGKYSRIVLSTDAAKCLEFDPIILSSFRADMKGIRDDVEVFEVESGLFEGIDIRATDKCDAKIIEGIIKLSDSPNSDNASWIKSFVISVLETMCKKSPVPADQKRYRDLQYKLAWHSVGETDPILLYLRSRECRESGERTRELRYLKSILARNPHFVPARLLLAKACRDIVKETSEREEIVFARDTAKEFLGKYKHYLKKDEVEQFSALISDSRVVVGGEKRYRGAGKKK